MPSTRQQRFQRPAPDVAQDHPRRRGEPVLQADALDHGGAVNHRHLREHALGRRQPHRPHHRKQRAADCRQAADQQGNQNHAGQNLVVEIGETEGRFRIDMRQPLAEPGAERHPGRHASSAISSTSLT